MIGQHKLAFGLAILIGVIYIFPQLYFIYDLGDDYQGVYMSGSYDEVFYYDLIRQVYDGRPVTINPFLVEYPETSVSSMYRPIEYTLGILGKFFNLSISKLALISKFIFPALIFLAIYFFILTLTRSPTAGRLSALTVLLGFELAPLNISSAVNTFLFDSPAHFFLFFSRPINPQISAIFFFVALWALANLWHQPESNKNITIAGLAVGALAYVYFYFWNFTVIFNGLICSYALIRRDKKLLRAFSFSLGLSLIIALPYLASMFSILTAGAAKIQQNYILTRRFIGEKVILIPLGLLATVYLWNFAVKKINHNFLARFDFLSNRQFIFLFFLVLAGLVASNQQIIHGYEVQQHHYHFMTNIPIFIITMTVIGLALLERYLSRLKPYLIGLLLLVVIWHALGVQISSYKFWSPVFAYNQSYAEAFTWLNQNTAIDDVIYTNRELEELVPMYTHNSVYDALHASVYPTPLARLEHNYFVNMAIIGITAEEAKTYLFTNRNDVGQRIFEGQYWRAICGSFGCFPDSVLDDLALKYQNFLTEALPQRLKTYRLDYVLWDQTKNPIWRLEQFDFLKEVWRSKSLVILTVR